MAKKLLFVFIAFCSTVHAQFNQSGNDKNVYDFINKTREFGKKNEKQSYKRFDSLKVILEKNKKDTLLGLLYRKYSDVLASNSKNKEALTKIEQSINFYKKGNSKKEEVLSIVNKGNIFFRSGDVPSAIKTYNFGRNLATKYGLVSEVAKFDKNLGVVFFDQGNIDGALKQYKIALDGFLKAKNEKELAGVYLNIGNCYFENYQTKESLLYYNKSLDFAKKYKDTVNLSTIYNNLGAVYIDDKKDTLTGIKYMTEALKLKKNGNIKNQLIFQYSNFATLYAEMKSYKNALFYNDKAYELAIKNHDLDNLKDIYENYALIYSKQGNYEKAFAFQKQFSSVKDSLLNKENTKIINEINTKYQTEKKEKLILEKENENKKKNIWIAIISLLTVFSSILGYLFYRQQKLKNKQQEQEYKLQSAISQIETQNKLQELRLSISRDLHDNIGAQLTFIISSIDHLKYRNTIEDEKVTNQLSKISNFTKSTITELRDTIWAMNVNELTFEDLETRIFNFIEKAKSAKENVTFNFKIDESLKDRKMTSLTGINLYRTIQEAINNAIKYAEANTISLEINQNQNQINTKIEDNGKGFDAKTTRKGNGLYNMDKRISEIGGEFLLKTLPENGTNIQVNLPKNLFYD